VGRVDDPTFFAMKRICHIIFLSILVSGCISHKKDAFKIQNASSLSTQAFTIPLNFKGMSIYEGSNNTILNTNGNTYFFAFNHLSSEIDVFSINELKFIKRIAIPTGGPNSFYSVNFLRVFNNNLVVEDGPFMHTINLTDLQFNRYDIRDRIDYHDRIYFLTTSLFVANFDTGFTIDTTSGIAYFPLYPGMRKSNPDYWSGKIICRALLPEFKFQPLDMEFPELFKQGNHYGEMDRPQLMIKGDSLIYTFTSDPTIYVYNTKSKILTETKPGGADAFLPVEPYAKKGLTIFENTFEHAYTVGNYLPMTYDPWKKLFYRIRRPSRQKGEYLDPTKDINILMVFDEKLTLLSQHYLPQNLHYFFHVTPKGLFFQVKESSHEPDENFYFVMLQIR
jgi:hypothetical protein